MRRCISLTTLYSLILLMNLLSQLLRLCYSSKLIRALNMLELLFFRKISHSILIFYLKCSGSYHGLLDSIHLLLRLIVLLHLLVLNLLWCKHLITRLINLHHLEGLSTQCLIYLTHSEHLQILFLKHDFSIEFYVHLIREEMQTCIQVDLSTHFSRIYQIIDIFVLILV